jgi:hypothetical protein
MGLRWARICSGKDPGSNQARANHVQRGREMSFTALSSRPSDGSPAADEDAEAATIEPRLEMHGKRGAMHGDRSQRDRWERIMAGAAAFA